MCIIQLSNVFISVLYPFCSQNQDVMLNSSKNVSLLEKTFTACVWKQNLIIIYFRKHARGDRGGGVSSKSPVNPRMGNMGS